MLNYQHKTNSKYKDGIYHPVVYICATRLVLRTIPSLPHKKFIESVKKHWHAKSFCLVCYNAFCFILAYAENL